MSDTVSIEQDFSEQLKRISAAVDAVLDDMLAVPGGPQKRLYEAMRYGVFSGGKRLRPFLLVQAGAILGARRSSCLRAAAAIECIHAYSLIHDDLPALDDDDMRRGKPSVHARYDQATAILAGDALQTLAFAILSDKQTHPDAAVRADLVAAASLAAGAHGMVGGQMIDIEQKGRPTREQDTPVMIRMALMKTGALIGLSCELAAILARASVSQRQALAGFARDFGLAYQIFDDTDDARRGHSEGFVAALGLDQADARGRMLTQQARQHLALFGSDAGPLALLADHIASR